MEKGSNLSGTQRLGLSAVKQDYTKLIAPYQEQLINHTLTSQPLMMGELYNKNAFENKHCRIMFVGRAVNGWEIDFQNGSIDDLVQQVFDSASNVADISKGALESGYNYNRSPFFQLCHAILTEMSLSEDWQKRFAWTNLYKIAPYQKGNPNNTLIGDTIDTCAEILRHEIAHCRPTHIVFVTDKWWYMPEGKTRAGKPIYHKAFSDMLKVSVDKDASGAVIGSGISSEFWFEPKIVITNRPESAKMSRATQAQQIVEAFSRL